MSHGGGRPATCRQRGITLIELMVVVIIVGIMASIAVPAYNNYMREARRSEARSALNQIAAQQAEYILNHSEYAVEDDVVKLGVAFVNGDGDLVTENEYYLIEVSSTDGFTVRAEINPAGLQSNDSGCSWFSLNAVGAKDASGADCW